MRISALWPGQSIIFLVTRLCKQSHVMGQITKGEISEYEEIKGRKLKVTVILDKQTKKDVSGNEANKLRIQ